MINKKATICLTVISLCTASAYWIWREKGYVASSQTVRNGVGSKELSTRFPAANVGTTFEVQEPDGVRPSESEGAEDWGIQYVGASDYGVFVGRAAKSALAGNGRAAYYVSQALGLCADIIQLARVSQNPWVTFQDGFAKTPYTPPWVRDKQVKKFNKCISLSRGNVFDAFPPVDGGYTYAYWRNLALSRKDPLAIADETNRVSLNISNLRSPEERSAAIEEVKGELREVISTKDKEALFTAGSTITNGSLGVDVLKGFALSLVACDLGYDCSVKNTTLPLADCLSVGTCNESYKYSDELMDTLGSSRFATVYAQSKEIQLMLEHDELEELQKYLGLSRM